MAERIYLQRPGKDDVVSVATGFSWGALLLGFVWAMSKRMWFATFVMLGVSTILFLSGLWGDTIGTIGLVLSVLFGVACGVYGNQWHRRTLEKRGYVVMPPTGEGK
jgi:ABC-type proline/glycine betaine transport system permease subunit